MTETTLPKTLEEMLTLSNARAVYQNQVRLAELKFKNNCVLGFAGGEFHITPDLLGYLHHRVAVQVERVVMLDINNVPVLVDDLETLLEIASDKYHSALNTYYEEVQKLKSSRKPEVMVGVAE